MKTLKRVLSKIPESVKKLVLLFLTIALVLVMFWYSQVVLGLPAINSGIVPGAIFVFVLGLLYVPYDDEEK